MPISAKASPMLIDSLAGQAGTRHGVESLPISAVSAERVLANGAKVEAAWLLIFTFHDGPPDAARGRGAQRLWRTWRYRNVIRAEFGFCFQQGGAAAHEQLPRIAPARGSSSPSGKAFPGEKGTPASRMGRLFCLVG